MNLEEILEFRTRLLEPGMELHGKYGEEDGNDGCREMEFRERECRGLTSADQGQHSDHGVTTRVRSLRRFVSG